MLTRTLHPAVTNSFRQKLAGIRVPGKRLHSFNGETRPEVVIGNNSIVFSSLASILAHSKQYGRNIHSQLRFVSPDFWLDHTHADYANNFWGQTIEEIPQFVRELFLHLFKDQKPHDLITWGQLKEVRTYAYTWLEQEFGIPIHQGIPTITATPTQNYEFTIANPPYKSRFIMPNNVYVYDYHRKFSTDQNIHSDIPQLSHTYLYRFPKNQIPHSIIVLGDGESVIWLAAHFRDSTIYYLSRSSDPDPLQKHLKPSHRGIDINNAIKLPFTSADGSHYYNLTLTPYEQSGSNFRFAPMVRYYDDAAKISITGHFFTCIGMQPEVYTRELPATQVLRLRDEIPKFNFHSTKNIPRGGLMDSWLRVMEATNNMDHSWEPSAILLSKGHLASFMQQFLLKYGINEHHIADLPELLQGITEEKNKFSAMVKLYKDKVNNDPQKVADFEIELLELYEKSKKALIPN